MAKVARVDLGLDKLKESAKGIKLDVDDKAGKYKLAKFGLELDKLSKKVSNPRVSVSGVDRAAVQLLGLEATLDRINGKSADVRTNRLGLKSLVSGSSFWGGLKGLMPGGSSTAADGAAAGGTGLADIAGSPVGIAGIAALLTMLPALLGGAATLGVGGLGYMLGNKGLTTINADKQALTQAQTSIAGSKHPSLTQLLALHKAQQQLNRDTHGWAGEFAKVGQQFQPIVRQVMGFVRSLAGPLSKLFAASVPGIKAFITALEPAIKQALPIFTQFIKAMAPDMKILGQAFGDLLLASVKALNGMSAGFHLSAVVVKGVVDGIGGLLTWLGGLIGGVVRLADDLIHGKWAAAWRDAQGIARNFLNFISDSFGKLQTILQNIGIHAMEGLLSGLKSAGGSVLSWIGGFVTSIPGKFMSLLGIHSPSTVMRKIGQNINQGLLQGLTGTSGQINAATAKLATDVRDAFKAGMIGQGRDSWLTSFLARDNKRLHDLAARRSAILNTIKQARAYATSTTQNILGGYNIVSQAGQSGLPVTAGSVMQNLVGDLAQVREFASNLKKLKKMGLNKNLLRQIIDAGPVQGGPIAAALASASGGSIHNINSEESQLTLASNRVGAFAANAMFDSGKNAGKGFLSGLKGQERQIESMMRHLAEVMVKTIRKELGIRSPSAVMHDLGLNIGQGLSLGLDHSADSVRSSAARLGRAVPMSFGHVFTPSGGSYSTGNGQATLTIKGEGDDLLRAILKSLRYDIRTNGGGNVQRHLGWT